MNSTPPEASAGGSQSHAPFSSSSSSPSSSPRPSLTPQRLHEKGPNDTLILHSPYGPTRNTVYGWGSLFKPPMSAVVPGYPNIHIGVSSLNGVPTVGKSDRSMRSLLTQYRKKFNCLEHCYPYHKVGDAATWRSWADLVRDTNVVPSGLHNGGGVDVTHTGSSLFTCSSVAPSSAAPQAASGASTDTNTNAPVSAQRLCVVRASRFLYTIKVNNLLTHVKQLQMRDSEVQELVQTFFHARCPELEPFLGPILVQLPPSFGYSKTNVERLTELYEQLTTEEVLLQEVPEAETTNTTAASGPALPAAFPQRRIRIAVEFRNRAWYRQETFDLLRAFRWALVVAHHHDDPTFSTVVDTGAGFLYVRLHGPLGRSVGDYGSLAMKLWAEELVHYLTSPCDATAPASGGTPKEVFVFLNNSDSHVGGTTSSTVDATCLAEHLRQLLPSPAAGADAAPPSATSTPATPPQLPTTAVPFKDRPVSAPSTQQNRSISATAPSQQLADVAVTHSNTTHAEDAPAIEHTGSENVRSNTDPDDDEDLVDLSPPAKRPRTSTQSGASRDDEVIID